jgi:hypothetical protein
LWKFQRICPRTQEKGIALGQVWYLLGCTARLT